MKASRLLIVSIIIVFGMLGFSIALQAQPQAVVAQQMPAAEAAQGIRPILASPVVTPAPEAGGEGVLADGEGVLNERQVFFDPLACGAEQEKHAIYEASFESEDDCYDCGWYSTGFHLNDIGYPQPDGFTGWRAYGSTIQDQHLVSPPIVLPAHEEKLRLRFYNKQYFDEGLCSDGGLLEISTDNGASWRQVPNEALLTDKYDGVVGPANPLAGRQAWCASEQDWLPSIVKLDEYAGQTVRFRYRLGTNFGDTSIWFIDEVLVQSCRQPGGLELVANNDVGVIPDEATCPDGFQTAAMVMDDEDINNKNKKTGWTGGIAQGPDATLLVFCRVPGDEFKHLASDPYAVLQLGSTCPNGSFPASRYFDNEDNENDNQSLGTIRPNESGDNTLLHFCYFNGDDAYEDFATMTEFPNLGFSYGVFASSDFKPALQTGSVYIDEENNKNQNHTSNLTGDGNFNRIVTPVTINGIAGPIARDTRLNLVQVSAVTPRTVPPLEISLHDTPCPMGVNGSTCGTPYETIIETFAETVFEMSNGAHQVGDVTIYQNGEKWNTADIRLHDGLGRARTNTTVLVPFILDDAVQTTFLYIDLFDEYGPSLGTTTSYISPTTFISLPHRILTNQEELGEILAHEFGHYFYGLFDEYREEGVMPCWADRHPRPCDIDDGVDSVMHDQHRWREFSTDFSFNMFNRQNNQYRSYGASGWTTLAQHPSQDRRYVQAPPSGWGVEKCNTLEAIGEKIGDIFGKSNEIKCTVNVDEIDQRTRWIPVLGRPYHEELADAAPTSAGPRNDLTPGNDALALLDIDWQMPSAALTGLGSERTEEIVSERTTKIPVVVDGGADQIDISISWDGTSGKSPGKVIIRNPAGDAHSEIDCSASNFPGLKEPVCKTTIIIPEAGEWQIEIEIPEPPLTIETDIEISTSQPGPQYLAALSIPQGAFVVYPDPVMVVARMSQRLPIARAGLTAIYVAPDGQEQALPLNDDGVVPDMMADDGLYSGYLDFDQNGAHHVKVWFDNDAGDAVFTSRGMADAGDQPLVPVGENFHRQAATVVEVAGVRPDDHAGSPDKATPLKPENLDLPGRIDFPGDIDIFEVTPEESGQLVTRVAGLGLDMEPRMRVLSGENCGAQLVDAVYDPDPDPPQSDRYPAAVVDVMAGMRICIEVSHRDPNADKGLYYVSAGTPLAGDSAQKQTIDSPAPADGVVGDKVTLPDASDAGLPVVYQSDSPEVCTVSGNTAVLVAAGTCTITASQEGDDWFAPADEKVVTIAVQTSGASGHSLYLPNVLSR